MRLPILRGFEVLLKAVLFMDPCLPANIIKFDSVHLAPKDYYYYYSSYYYIIICLLNWFCRPIARGYIFPLTLFLNSLMHGMPLLLRCLVALYFSGVIIKLDEAVAMPRRAALLWFLVRLPTVGSLSFATTGYRGICFCESLKMAVVFLGLP